MRVIVLIISLLLPACSLFPPEPQAIVENARANGCAVKGVMSTDSFNWRFLGLSTSRTTNVSCHKELRDE